MTAGFFRARLDQMIDLRHPLAALAQRLPWDQIEAALAPAFARRNREGRVVTGETCSAPPLSLPAPASAPPVAHACPSGSWPPCCI